MAKEKKPKAENKLKTDKKPKADKKPRADKKSKAGKVASEKGATKAAKAAGSSKLKSLAEHPLVADVVAAALVATASALKNPDRARALASEAADELANLSKAGSERGNALWDMALQIGKRTLESFAGETASRDGASKPSKKK